VIVTTDAERFRDLKGLTVGGELVGGKDAVVAQPVTIESLPYYKTEAVDVAMVLPAVAERHAFQLITTVTGEDGKLVSRTMDAVEVFPKVEVPSTAMVVKGDVNLAGGSELRRKIEGGATVVLMSPGKGLAKQFPDDIVDVKSGMGEFADPSPVLGTPLGKDIKPMDIKWWARKGDWKCYVATQSHRLKEGGKARSLLDFTPAHSYISAEKLPDQFRTVLFEIPLGRGRLWVCDLDFNASLGVDPAADLLMRNIQQAAGDPESTAHLPALPSHADMVKAVGRPAQ
jgi:hypothetical protein